MTPPSLFESDRNPASADARADEPSPPRAGASSLYRKYRPTSFSADELVGQDHVVRTLRNAIALDRVAHAYLFSGPRGTGKTTTARILAKAVNCLDPDPGNRPCNACANCVAINSGSSPDVIEIDAASNRGIDDIRDLRDRVRYAPAQLRSKVYIIDEAHQITGAAANAFLKTLEEPPIHSRFILATTDPEELLPTIVSRCQSFEFRRVAADDMARRLRTVAQIEQIAITDDALRAIARHATGSLRDALGTLEQLSLHHNSAADGEIGVEHVRALLGLSHNERIEAIIAALAERSPGRAIAVVQEALADGEDPRQINRQLVSHLRLLLLERSGGLTDLDPSARELANRFSLTELANHARRFSEIDFSIKHAPLPQLPLEVAIVEATTSPNQQPDTQPELQADRPSPPPTPRPTMLRDRVRNGASLREPGKNEAAPPARPDPVPITQFRPATAEPTAPQTGDAHASVELIADLWPNVRADVKALNRRIEALLSEVDPVAVSGSQITLAVPYPFHRDKLNSDDVRETIAGVLSRLLNRTVTVHCVLRGELGVGPAPSPPPVTANGAITTAEPNSAEPDDWIESRVRAAKNIFDADEVDPASLGLASSDEARG